MKIKLSIDDGCASDMRVAELCKKYGIECVFYWPVNWTSLAYSNGYKPLSHVNAEKISEVFEIGSHTITHRHLTRISTIEAKDEIKSSKEMLETMFNVKVTKFAPPRGYTNKELTDYTLKHYDSQRLTKGKGLLHIHPNSGANGNIHWLDYAKQNDITEAWGHSWEFDKYKLWKELEKFMKEVSRG